MIYLYILTYKHSVHSINPANVGHGITKLLTQHMSVIAILSSAYLKLSYFSGTLILVILARGLVIAKFNTH